MNPIARSRKTSPKRRPSPGPGVAALIAAAFLAMGGAVSACGGGSPRPSSATRSSTTQGGSVLAYSSCMRARGVPNFPDPGAGGGIIDKAAVVRSLTAVSKSVADSAQNACQHLLPAGGLGGQAARPVPVRDQKDYLNAAACMRSHGITNFPDPTFSGGNVTLNIPSSVDTKSPQFTQAAHTCSKLIPTGLPYSHGTAG